MNLISMRPVLFNLFNRRKKMNTDKKNRMISLTLAVLLLSMFITLSVSTTFAAGVKRGGTLIMARYQDTLSLNSLKVADNGSIWVVQQIMQGLVTVDETGRGLKPGLAESWKISPDKMLWTFELRDARFSNGDSVTAEDVVYTFELNRREGAEFGYLLGALDTVKALDSRTVEFRLKTPDVSFLSTLSFFSMGILNKKVHQADPERHNTEPVGAGAFMVETYKRGDRTVLVPNPYYWEKGKDGKPLPYIDRVEMRYVPESSARVLGLRKADYDIIMNVPTAQVRTLRRTSGINLDVAVIYKVIYVSINHDRPPFDNRDVRLALNYATNREAIQKVVFHGLADLNNSSFASVSYDATKLPGIPYDPEKAKSLLKKADFDNSKPIKLFTYAGDPTYHQIAAMLKQNWEEAGVTIDINEIEQGSLTTKFFGMDYSLLLFYFTNDINDENDMTSIVAEASAGENGWYTGYHNVQADLLSARGRTITDPQERIALYKILHSIIHFNDAFSVPIASPPIINATRDHVRDFRTLTTAHWWLKDVWLDR